MTLPPTCKISQRDTHRLVNARYGKSVLTRIADDDSHLETILELDNITNERLHAENDLLPGITPLELVSGFYYSHIVNAAFCHAHPQGSRFNDSHRGAWYASFELETALTEIIFHRTLDLNEINCFDDDITCDDYLADFNGKFHDLRGSDSFTGSLDYQSYVASQSLGRALLTHDTGGIVYPSVRQNHGTNLVCFRPALVNNVRKGQTCHIVWNSSSVPEVSWIVK